MRIVGGEFRGRVIHSPEGGHTRPTGDRVRQSLFNILEHGIPGLDLEGARVIDLFAGTGALGLEALSRGAAFCIFVDNAASARALIQENVAAFGLGGRTKIFRRDAGDLGASERFVPFDLVFIDPPYGQGDGQRALASLAAGGWLKPGAICVLEEDGGVSIEAPAGYLQIDRRVYGGTQILFFSWQSSGVAGDEIAG